MTIRRPTKTEEWSAALNAVASRLTRSGAQPVSLSGGSRDRVERPAAGPDGWGVRRGATFLFPR